ncbi:MAG TPA: hypothetical protein VN783_17165, partial [Thermoanaerobaculia bacterium]|nr:hypothetical protein [Thermoanaerobaculia bacterium]
MRRRVWSDYVRTAAAGKTPEEAEVREVLRSLGAALKGELRRRGLWDSPPGYVGVYGWERWEEGEEEGTVRAFDHRSGALEELRAECFAFVFVDRLRALAAQLRQKDNIDGLVILNIKNFLYERQRECDPLGARVFDSLWRAVRAAVDAGELRILEGDLKVRNDTLLAFEATADAEGRPAEEIGRVAVRWVDQLLPDLVTARGRHQDAVVERLRGFLPELWDAGVLAFRFRDLIDPMKAAVRARWAAELERSEERLGLGVIDKPGETGAPREAVEPILAPRLPFEERDRFRALVACVLEALARLPIDERTR